MKKIVQIILLQLVILGAYAQDPQFSQFYAAPLYLGPSMAGSSDNGRLCLNFRDQWPKLSGKFITYAVSYDQYLSRYYSGVGLLFLRDDAGNGKLTTTQVGLNYSYRLRATKDFFLQPGMQFQYYQRKINFSKLTFADQFYGDQILPGSVELPPDNQAGHIDFTFSLLAFTKNMWLGGTVDHVMKTSQVLAQDIRYVPVKVSVYGGIKLTLNESLLNKDEQNFSLAFNYRNQEKMQQLDIGAYYNRLPFLVGIWYRGIPVLKGTETKDAITVSGGVLVKDLMFTYSYDLTVSSLITSTGGAHELALVYIFDRPQVRGKRKMGSVPCPKF
jgi:type IX secretion system PorP/SprF family membrane protein